MPKIMVVEDDVNSRDAIVNILKNSNYEVAYIRDFSNTVTEILDYKANLILLDINLPYLNGEVILKEIRKNSNVPIIMLTSKVNDVDEVLSLSYGADDYITKPFNPTILLLHISAILRRMENPDGNITYNDLTINIGKGIIKRNDTEIILTKNEMIIFSYLLNHKNKIVTRDELMTDLWNNEEYINDNALTVNISRLRAKLEIFGYKDAIQTRKGLGYILS